MAIKAPQISAHIFTHYWHLTGPVRSLIRDVGATGNRRFSGGPRYTKKTMLGTSKFHTPFLPTGAAIQRPPILIAYRVSTTRAKEWLRASFKIRLGKILSAQRNTPLPHCGAKSRNRKIFKTEDSKKQGSHPIVRLRASEKRLSKSDSYTVTSKFWLASTMIRYNGRPAVRGIQPRPHYGPLKGATNCKYSTRQGKLNEKENKPDAGTKWS